MIRISTENLSGEEFENWQKRARKARKKLLDHWNSTGKPPSSKQLNSQIWKDFKKDFLLDNHKSKCAYCEGKISAYADLHVEHYRPKGEVTEDRKECEHPGYFWLAYEWYNLILACPYCNTDHATEEQRKRVKHPGKKNEFCVEGTRVCEPSADPDDWLKELEEEEPRLLHPYFDNPQDHITFDDKGFPCPKNGSERGRETIEVCNLDRTELAEERREARRSLRSQAWDIMSGRDVEDEFISRKFSAWQGHCLTLYMERLAAATGRRVVLIPVS